MLNLTKVRLYLRKVLVILVTLLVLSVVTIKLGIFFFFDEDKVKGVIVSCFKKEFNREVAINGDIKLRALPFLTLDINNLSVAKHEQEFLQSISVGKVKIKVCLLPCLWKSLEIKEIVCEDFDVSIKAMPVVDKPTTLELKRDTLTLNKSGHKKHKFKIGHIDCKHFNIHYSDLQNKQWFINNLNVDLVGINILNASNLKLDILRFLGKKGKVTLSRLSCNECVIISNLDILWKNDGKQFVLEKLLGNFEQQGLFKGHGTVDNKIKMKLLFSDVNINNIKKYDSDWKISGILSGDVEYIASLHQIKDAKVIGNVRITDVVWEDFSLEKEVFKVLSPVLPWFSTTVKMVGNNTLVDSLMCDFQILKNKELGIKKLSFQGIKLNGDGMGMIDLEKLHGILQLNLSLQRIPGVVIPLVLSGDLSKPRIKVNLKDFKFNELLKLGIK